MSKGTIIYVGGFELPDKNAAAHRVLSNGKIFRELGYNVVFIDVDRSLKFDSDIFKTNKNVQGFDCWSVPYPHTPIQWLRHLSNINHIVAMNDHYKDIKVIVAYNYPALALFKIKKECKKNSIKIIADCTEWFSTKGSNVIYKILKGLDSFFRMRVLQKQLDGLIVISKYLDNYYKNCDNVVRIPPLVDIYEKKWTTIDGRNSVTTEKDKEWRFIYSGSPGRDKDKINYIIDALYKLRTLDNYQLDIVGISKAQFIEYYPTYSEKVKILNHRVNFIGRVSHEESLKKLMKADYSIFIRDKSRLTMAGFPTKFVESVTCSTQVITNDSSDISEYYEENSTGTLITGFSVEKLAEVLRRIIEKEHSDSELDSKMFHYKRYEDLIEHMLSNIIK